MARPVKVTEDHSLPTTSCKGIWFMDGVKEVEKGVPGLSIHFYHWIYTHTPSLYLLYVVCCS